MLRASFLFTMQMLRDRKTSIHCTTSSLSWNGLPWTAFCSSLKMRRMMAREHDCCPMLEVTGCDSTSCLHIPRRNPSLRSCTEIHVSYTVFLPHKTPDLKQKDTYLRLSDVHIPWCGEEKRSRKDCTARASGAYSGSRGRWPSCTIYGDAQGVYSVRRLLYPLYAGSCGLRRVRMTSNSETCLLTHLFSLCLRIDDYATDTTLIAADLKMSPTRCDLLRTTYIMAN
jgi:hypothetical protein